MGLPARVRAIGYPQPHLRDVDMTWLLVAVLGPPALYGVVAAVDDWRSPRPHPTPVRRHPSTHCLSCGRMWRVEGHQEACRWFR